MKIPWRLRRKYCGGSVGNLAAVLSGILRQFRRNSEILRQFLRRCCGSFAGAVAAVSSALLRQFHRRCCGSFVGAVAAVSSALLRPFGRRCYGSNVAAVSSTLLRQFRRRCCCSFVGNVAALSSVMLRQFCRRCCGSLAVSLAIHRRFYRQACGVTIVNPFIAKDVFMNKMKSIHLPNNFFHAFKNWHDGWMDEQTDRPSCRDAYPNLKMVFARLDVFVMDRNRIFHYL